MKSFPGVKRMRQREVIFLLYRFGSAFHPKKTVVKLEKNMHRRDEDTRRMLRPSFD